MCEAGFARALAFSDLSGSIAAVGTALVGPLCEGDEEGHLRQPIHVLVEHHARLSGVDGGAVDDAHNQREKVQARGDTESEEKHASAPTIPPLATVQAKGDPDHQNADRNSWHLEHELDELVALFGLRNQQEGHDVENESERVVDGDAINACNQRAVRIEERLLPGEERRLQLEGHEDLLFLSLFLLSEDLELLLGAVDLGFGLFLGCACLFLSLLLQFFQFENLSQPFELLLSLCLCLGRHFVGTDTLFLRLLGSDICVKCKCIGQDI